MFIRLEGHNVSYFYLLTRHSQWVKHLLYEQHLHPTPARSLSFFHFRLISVVVLSQTMSLSIKKDSSCINSIFYDILSRLHVFDNFSDVFLYCSWGVCFPALYVYTSLMTLRGILLVTAPSHASERFQMWVAPIVRALGVEISVADSRMT